MSVNVLPRLMTSQTSWPQIASWQTGSTHSSGAHSLQLFYSGTEDKWSAVFAALRQWSALEPDWDGPSSANPSPGAISFLRSFASIASSRHIPEPQPFFAADGEVGFRWSSRRKKAILSMQPDGKVVGFAENGNNNMVRITGAADWGANWQRFVQALEDSD